MTRRFTILASVLLLIGGVAGAQPAPTDAQPAPPPADQTPPTTGPTTTTTTTTTTTVAPTPPIEMPPPKEEKKDDKPAVLIKYDNGSKLYTEDEKFKLKISFRNQVRFESNRSFDDETPTRHNQFLNTIYIPRARLQAEGHLFGTDNRFKVEVGFGDSGSFSFLKDMFLEKRLPDSPIYLRFGQWKRPFNRPEMVSDFSSTFNERSIENELAGGGRSLGVALHNDYEKSPEGIEWAFGMFDSFSGGSDRPAITTTCVQNPMTMVITCNNSRPTTFPTDFGPTLIARVGWNSPKMKGYSESDLEGGPLRYAVGLSYKIDLANLAKGNEESWGDNMSHGLEIDAMIKAMGYSVHAGAVLMKLKTSDPEYGLFLQPTMFVIPKRAEIAARFALATQTVPGAMAGETISRNQLEARAAFNWYWHGHTWKLANDVGFLMLTGDQPASDNPDLQIRMMMQLQI